MEIVSLFKLPNRLPSYLIMQIDTKNLNKYVRNNVEFQEKGMREKMYTFCVVNIERLRIQIDLKIGYFLLSYSILKFMKQLLRTP